MVPALKDLKCFTITSKVTSFNFVHTVFITLGEVNTSDNWKKC